MLIAKSMHPLLGLKVVNHHVFQLLGHLKDASEDHHEVLVNAG